MVKDRKLSEATPEDHLYAAIKGVLPWGYFYAAYEKDEVATFWAAVYGGATVGSIIGTILGGGLHAAMDSKTAYFFLKRFLPTGILLGTTDLQRYIGQEIDAEQQVAMNYVATGSFVAAMPIVSSADSSDPRGGVSWNTVRSLFGF